uniref:Uncharacterized protein n=1 Tax=Arundo donax TaxID=35708 RepID=A0A0A9HN53_ARUDO
MTAARSRSEETVGWILCTTASVAVSKRRQASGEIEEGSGCAGTGSGSGTGEHSSMSTMGVGAQSPGRERLPLRREATAKGGDLRRCRNRRKRQHPKDRTLGAWPPSQEGGRTRSARIGPRAESRSARRRRGEGIRQAECRIREHGSEGF